MITPKGKNGSGMTLKPVAADEINLLPKENIIQIIVNDKGGVKVNGFPTNRTKATGILLAALGAVNQHFAMMEMQGRMDPMGNIKPEQMIIKPTSMDVLNVNKKKG